MNTKTITEPSRKIPVEASYDVAVVGGGIAGVAAALAAAREGVEVVLLERTFGLGGLATLGNVIMYLPLCDGMGRQVMAGIAEELLHLSVYDVRRANRDARFLPVPDCWKGGDEEQAEARQKKRLMAAFNPASFQIEMEVLLEKEGVALMYDTRVCQVQTKADQVSHLIVENKSGRLGLEVGAVIDASGDADVCAVAGCPVEVFDSNVLAAWH
jgi:2-polyprenyl-6-methoxyphenol hydroxylase-like FAD-dependent oxidoreductase